MRTIVTALITSMLTITAALAGPGEDRILGNPGFEEGGEKDFAPWVASGTATHIGPFEWQYHEGRRAGGIGNDQGPENGHGEIAQEIHVPGDVRKGDIFLFNAWVMTEDRYTGKASLAIEFLDAGDRVLKTECSPMMSKRFEWTNVTVTAEAPKGARKVVVKCLSTNMVPGQGLSFVWFDHVRVDCPVITASSTLDAESAPEKVMSSGAWHSKRAEDQWLVIDSRADRPFTGLSIDWADDYATEYEVLSSHDGQQWTSLYATGKEAPGPDTIYVSETSTRFIKIHCLKSRSGQGFGIDTVRLMGSAEVVTPKRYYEILAEQEPARYARWLLHEEAYWTGVGVPDDVHEAILGEDGTIEPFKRNFTIAPFLYVDNQFVTRDDAKVSQSLEREYLPIPSVKWAFSGVDMSVQLLADGRSGESIAYARYRIDNRRTNDVSGKLFLTFRPLQIYPPWQGGGGWAPIRTISFSNHIVTVNDQYRVASLTPVDAFGAVAGSEERSFPFKTPAPPELKGDITGYACHGALPEATEALDTNALASAALAYDFQLGPGESREIFLAMPLHDKQPSLNADMRQAKVRRSIDRMLKKSVRYWGKQVDRIQLDIPDRDLVNMLKANIAFSFITKDGPAFQPGARSYDKAWMRDGGMSAAALLRVGFTSEVREFIDWFSTFQFESGEVPPIIDTKEKDPLWEEKERGLIEYDSQGEYIYTVLQYYYFTKDKAFLEGKLTNVVKDLEFLVSLRKQTLTPEFRDGPPARRKYYGILPPSTSHEGYGKEYSYWDDFWALRGWKDGRTIFTILGRDDLAAWAAKEYADFKQSFYESVRLTMETAKIDFIPGSASLADFDATSTAVALMYCDELDNLPQPALKNTFDRYDRDFRSRFEPGAVWRIVPYELRSVPALLFMGEKARALDLLYFMVACRRPTAWNQLAEVVHSDYRFPTYVGDMPHTWVGAEFIFAVRSLFLYERGGSLVIGAGIDPKWLDSEQGVAIRHAPTEFGVVSYSMKKAGNLVTVKISDKARPPAGILVYPPLDATPVEATVNDKPITPNSNGEIPVTTLPAVIVLRY